jgi:hypothetical protein
MIATRMICVFYAIFIMSIGSLMAQTPLKQNVGNGAGDLLSLLSLSTMQRLNASLPKESRSFNLSCACECRNFVDEPCVKTAWDSVAKQSIAATDGCSTVVYTITTSPRITDLKDPNLNSSTGACFVAFLPAETKVAQEISSGKHKRLWKVILVSKGAGDVVSNLRKESRMPKITPGGMFSSSVDYALYVDIKLILEVEPETIIKKALERTLLGGGKSQSVLMGIRHPFSSDVFVEHRSIMRYRNWRPEATHMPEVLDEQVKNYRYIQKKLARSTTTMGMTLDLLIEGGVLLHNMRLQGAKALRCLWYLEYQQQSDRDQVAFAYALSRLRAGKAKRGDATNRAIDVPLRTGTIADQTQSESGPVTAGSHVRLIDPRRYHWDRRGENALATLWLPFDGFVDRRKHKWGLKPREKKAFK